MAETKMPSTEEYNNLKQQLNVLSREKADLEILRDLINKLSPVTGLENLISHILTAVMDIVGSEKVTAYYRLDKKCISIDAYGKKNEFDCFDDPLIVEAIEKLSIIEKPAEKSTTTLGFPLIVGENVIGAVKIENITGNSKEIQWKLQPFINYVAVILNNEIKNSGELNATYQKLQETNTKLLEEINKHVKTEEQLQEKSDTLKTIFESIQIGIVIINPETHRIVYANPAAVKLIRAPREKIVGAECHKFICSAEKGNCPVTDLGQTVDNSERILITADWEERPIIKTVSHINISGREHLLETFFDITERKLAEEEKAKLLHDLNERVKELNCLYNISGLIDTIGITLEKILQGTVNFIPPAWQYPELTCAKIILENKEFKTDNFKNTKFKQSLDIKVHKEKAGSIEVCLLEKEFKNNEKPFSKEEDILLGAIAERLGKAVERLRAEDALKFSETRYRRLFEAAKDGILILDADSGQINDVNPYLTEILGYSYEDFLGKKLWEIGAFKDIAESKAHFKKLQTEKYIRYEHLPLHTANGQNIDVEFVSNTYQVNHKAVIQCNIRNITERKRTEKLRELTNKVLQYLNESGEFVDLIRKVLKSIQEHTGIEVAALRLREGDDYPYFVQYGFPDKFVKTENSLCERNKSGEIVRDNKGNPVLECMCGNIICGRTNPELSFFTKGGSFWSNCTTELLATTKEKDRQARTRNRCNGEGYESVALIPLRSGDKIIGLLQLNDKRKDMFTLELIEFFEAIGASIGSSFGRKKAEEKIKQAAEEWQRTFDSISDLIFIQDNDNVILRANKAFYDALKSRPEDIVGKKCFEVLHKANSPWPNCPFEKTKEDQKAHTEEVDDKNIGIPLLITTSPIFNDKDELIGSVHIAKDITEIKKSEEELAFKNALLTTQQETSIDGILVVDGKGKIISFNQRFVDMWGISSEIIESKSDERALQAILKEVADPIPFLTKVRYLYEHHHDTSRDEILLNDGRTFDRYSAPMFGDKDKYYGRVWYFRDITDHKQAEEKLIELSLMDELTGLNNRRGFSILAAKQIKNADRYKHGLTLIYIDLDNMKWINDNLGHKEGDRALVDISNIFKKSFRASDIIARLGGDEFAGLVVDSRGTTSDMILTRMQESINELNSQKTRTYTLSISFGAISYDNENPCSLNELLERGDKAMYEHKQKKGVRRGEKN